MINDSKLPLKEKFLEYYRELPVLKLAAESVGRNEDTAIRWKKEDPDFAYQVVLARAEWAKRQSKAVKSKEWLLERVLKEHFSEKKEIESEIKVSMVTYGSTDTP
jgi:hypothetical protein